MRRLPILLLFVAAAVALAAPPVQAEERALEVVVYGADRGLSGHPITALAQDRRGRLWAGSWGGGVLHHDGLAWRQVTSRSGLPADFVLGLVPGRHGEMWVSTTGGLTVFDGLRPRPALAGELAGATLGLETADGAVWLARREGGVARHREGLLEPVAGLEETRVLRLVESGSFLWLLGRPRQGDGTGPGSLWRWDGAALRPFVAADGVPAAPLHDLFRDRDGQLWLGADSGLYRLAGERFEPVAPAGVRLARPVHAIAQDAAGRLWLGSDGAVLGLAGEELRELKLPPQIGPRAVTAVVASPAGGLFAATSGHLLRLEGVTAEVRPLAGAGEPVPGGGDPAAVLRLEADLDQVTETMPPVLVDHEGGVWAVDGSRILRYRGDEARRFGRGEGLPAEDVRALHVDGRGRLWVATAQGLARFDPDAGHFETVASLREEVTAVFEDRGGAVYAGTAGGLLRIEGLTASPWAPAAGVTGVTAIAADLDGRLWIGTEEGGVRRVTADGLEGFGEAEGGLGPGAVLCLQQIDGELWAGQVGGLAHWTGEAFEPVPALAGRRVIGLIPTGASEPPRLWAVTPAGLVAVPGGEPVPPLVERTRLHAAHRSPDGTLWLGLDLGLLEEAAGAETLHVGGGFPAAPVTAIAADGEGRIWLGTAAGLYRHGRRSGPPSVWIESVVGGGEVLGAGGEGEGEPLAVTGACRDLEVRFGGVSFIGGRDGADLRFETRLLPRSPQWSAPGYERAAALGVLPPGTYTFEVRALSRDLVRSAPAQVEVTVGRPDEQPEPPRLALPDLARP